MTKRLLAMSLVLVLAFAAAWFINGQVVQADGPYNVYTTSIPANMSYTPVVTQPSKPEAVCPVTKVYSVTHYPVTTTKTFYAVGDVLYSYPVYTTYTPVVSVVNAPVVKDPCWMKFNYSAPVLTGLTSINCWDPCWGPYWDWGPFCRPWWKPALKTFKTIGNYILIP